MIWFFLVSFENLYIALDQIHLLEFNSENHKSKFSFKQNGTIFYFKKCKQFLLLHLRHAKTKISKSKPLFYFNFIFIPKNGQHSFWDGQMINKHFLFFSWANRSFFERIAHLLIFCKKWAICSENRWANSQPCRIVYTRNFSL